MTAEERQHVLAELPERRKRLNIAEVSVPPLA